MYNDPRYVKTHVAKTMLDCDDNEALEEVVALMPKMDKGKFIRQAIMDRIESFHAANSINRKAIQQDFLKEGISA